MNQDQKDHLAWRLDRHTHVGFLTAGRIARGEFGDEEIVDIFKRAEMTPHRAKIHAKKVETFELSDLDRAVLNLKRECLTAAARIIRGRRDVEYYEKVDAKLGWRLLERGLGIPTNKGLDAFSDSKLYELSVKREEAVRTLNSIDDEIKKLAQEAGLFIYGDSVLFEERVYMFVGYDNSDGNKVYLSCDNEKMILASVEDIRRA